MASNDVEGHQIHHVQEFLHTLRTQVTSIHHNVSSALYETFGVAWQPSGEPVWLLGHCYEPEPNAASAGTAEDNGTDALGELRSEENACGTTARQTTTYKPSAEFGEAWGSIIRMTYRKGFAPMYRRVQSQAAGSEEVQQQYIRLTSDAGWGCMIRVGQMLLATALKRHRQQRHMLLATALKRHQRHAVGPDRGTSPPGKTAIRSKEEVFVPLELEFLDDKRCPFSIFRFIEAALGRDATAPPAIAKVASGSQGATEGTRHACSAPPVPKRQLTKKDAGDWFGPTTISETIAALIEESCSLCKSFAVYVNVDGMLYEDEVRTLAFGDTCGLSPPASPPLIAGGHKQSGGANKHSPGADTDDEFTMVSTVPVLSATTLLQSPQLPTPLQAPSASLPEMADHDSEEDADLQLPPPLIPEDATAFQANSPTSSEATSASSASTLHTKWHRAVLLLFPLQLGLERNVSNYYVPALLRYFELQTSLGAMGGRPRMAHFFVGRQGPNLLYVDPHVVQPAALPAASGDAGARSNGSFAGSQTFKNLPSVQAIPIEHIDSSISLAFYCCCDDDLAVLITGLKKIDEAEENAPIRSEPVRPPELRLQKGESLHGDISGVPSDYDPSLATDLMLMEMAADSPQARKSRSRQSSFDLADEAIVEADDRNGTQVDSSKPKMNVGSAWACIEAQSYTGWEAGVP